VLVAFHKPYGVLSQFTPEPGSRWRTLAEFNLPKAVYAAGRLDADSEGLLLLTDEPAAAAAILERHVREYWVQVEGLPGEQALRDLAAGVVIAGYRTRPARAWRLEAAPPLAPREPPIRVRQSIPDSWIALELREGKNRQVRRMTAAVGHPTLRLVRARIGETRLLELGLKPGEWTRLASLPGG